MTTVHISPGSGRPSSYAKKMVAHAMFSKGAGFIAASVLLHQRGGFHDVVLHLLGQGLEDIQKGLLLAKNYDKYYPLLRGRHLGHDLVLGSEAVYTEYKFNPLRKDVRSELEQLNAHYRKHFLRYGGYHDVIGQASRDFNTCLVLRRTIALIRHGKKIFRK